MPESVESEVKDVVLVILDLLPFCQPIEFFVNARSI
jgi:hypothetical protein